jgi:hypothetical protein
MKTKIALFLLLSNLVSAQIKGVVKDSISGKPIPYVNIWIENENIGTTSEENGAFTINDSDKNKKFIFSALGYEKKLVSLATNTQIKLQPMDYQLEEVVVFNTLETKQIEIGKTKNTTYQAYDNGPKIDAKFFPYLEKYKKTKYLKKVSVFTDNAIETATFKIHFYSVDSNGFPGKELINKDFIVTIKKGVQRNIFNLANYNLKMPKNGLFVGFEKLIIEKNKLEKTLFNPNTNTQKTITTYYPLLLYNKVTIESLYSFSGGKWNKKTNENPEASEKSTVNEPAITLILTN